MKKFQISVDCISIVLVIMVAISMVFSFFSVLSDINKQLIKIEELKEENQILKNNIVSLAKKSNELEEEKKEINERFVRVLETQDKIEYLKLYKQISKELEDTAETIYDYTTDEEFTLLCQVVQAESGVCDFDGKVNVASTIINRYFDETFPNEWVELLFHKTNGVYQYTTIKNGSYLKQRKISKETIEAIEYAFLFKTESKNATYFHSGKSNWHENNLKLVYQDNWHKFYETKD